MKQKAVSCLLVLAAIMTLTPTIPTMAAENPDNTIQEATTTGTQGATITYEQDSAFTVTIPKTITLGQNKSATYDVKVKGDISGNETVTVTPDATLQLTDSNGKAAVTGTITQDITEFAATEVNQTEGSSTTGDVVANDLTAGNWSGNFEFAIGVEKPLAPGLYDADGKMVYTWKDSGIDVSKDANPTSSLNGIFLNRNNIKTIVIPSDVTSIGNAVFFEARITNAIIPDSVTSIGDQAFKDCSDLTSITIPDSVTSIGSGAFDSCSGLTSITIPDNVTSIGDFAFVNCSNIASVTYKGQTYTSKLALTTALTDNNVKVGTDMFTNTALTN